MPQPLDVAFIAGSTGTWRIDGLNALKGDSLPTAARLEVFEGAEAAKVQDGSRRLRGVTSNTRYTKREEAVDLASKQADLGRTEATRAVLITIRKSAAWWDLAQDERRAIFEEQSRHISIGTEYLPQVARRLQHSRDLGEPFDFLNWFEFAPEHTDAFNEMVGRLRQTAEWRYVDREIDIRLSR